MRISYSGSWSKRTGETHSPIKMQNTQHLALINKPKSTLQNCTIKVLIRTCILLFERITIYRGRSSTKYLVYEKEWNPRSWTKRIRLCFKLLSIDHWYMGWNGLCFRFSAMFVWWIQRQHQWSWKMRTSYPKFCELTRICFEHYFHMFCYDIGTSRGCQWPKIDKKKI